MKVKNVMYAHAENISAGTSIRDAAKKMNQLNSGFLPISHNDKLVGVVTDRDIAIRAVAAGKSLDDKVESIATHKLLYCFQGDDIMDVVNNMFDQHVQRLVVLDSPKSKNMVGVISMGRIADACNDMELAQAIVRCERQYRPSKAA